MLSTFYIFDIAMLLMVLIAALVGYARGMTQQILSIGGWLAAIILTIAARDTVTPFGRQYISNPNLADVVSLSIVFVILLLIFVSASNLIGRTIKKSLIGGLDRSLGIITGIVIFAGILSCAYIGVSFVVPPQKMPVEVTHSKTFPMVQWGADTIKRMLPKSVADNLPKLLKQKDNANIADALSSMKPKSSPAPTKKDGYSDVERQDMNNLVNTLGDHA